LGGTDKQPFASLSQDYRALLSTGFYNNADESVANVRLGNYSIPERYTERAGYTLTLTGLTPGVPYELQFFVNDYRTDRIDNRVNPNLTTIVRDHGGEVSLRQNAAGTDGSTGQYVIGRFTATDTTKVIELVGGAGKGGTDQRSAILNAYQLRQLPKSTDEEGTVGGTVPATLSLTFGAPATFGAFTPGVNREYTATTNATITSSAGDATLSHSEPGHLTNGTFSLAEALRVEFAKSAWSGPTSNEAVGITFKQLVAATDPLRTGNYSRTVTFTLSTTNP
jgi:hypothetical protein